MFSVFPQSEKFLPLPSPALRLSLFLPSRSSSARRREPLCKYFLLLYIVLRLYRYAFRLRTVLPWIHVNAQARVGMCSSLY